MKVISFNINGIRARIHQLQAIKDIYDPDVIALQETKVHDEQFPIAQIEELGYAVTFFGQKAHYGVAILTKKQPLSVKKGFPSDDDDAQKRLVGIEYESNKGSKVTILNGYFPQGESRNHPEKFPAKEKFYQDLQCLIETEFTPESPLLIVGDFNISSTDLDIGIGADNAKRWLRTGKCSFLPEEREWMDRLQNWGLTDTYREQHPQCSEFYSWFDYRSRGFEPDPKRGLRIDLILATSPMMKQLKSTGIGYDIRGMEKPSDHAPIWSEFDY